MTLQEHFELGFQKRAEEEGEKPSGLGTYFASKALQSRAWSDNAGKTLATQLGFSLPYLSQISALTGAGESLNNRIALGVTEAARRESLQKADSELAGTTLGDNAFDVAGKYAKPFSVAGGLAGGLGGLLAAYSATPKEQAIPALPIYAGLAGLAGGALGGGLLGGVAGGASGALQKAFYDNTSKASHSAAANMKAEHPYATSLPFGDAIGASYYSKDKKV